MPDKKYKISLKSVFFYFPCVILKANFQLWGSEMPSCNITPYQWCVYWLLGLSEDLMEGLKINKGPLLGHIDSLHLWLPVGLTNSTEVFDTLSTCTTQLRIEKKLSGSFRDKNIYTRHDIAVQIHGNFDASNGLHKTQQGINTMRRHEMVQFCSTLYDMSPECLRLSFHHTLENDKIGCNGNQLCWWKSCLRDFYKPNRCRLIVILGIKHLVAQENWRRLLFQRGVFSHGFLDR